MRRARRRAAMLAGRVARALQADAALRPGQVCRDERPPVGRHRVAEMETRRRCGRAGRRRDGRRECRVERLPELRGDAVLDRPHHVRHLVAQETHLLDRRGPHAGSQSRRKQQAHIGGVIAIKTVHGPALPIAVAPAVGGTNERFLAKYVGDEQALDAGEAADRKREGHRTPRGKTSVPCSNDGVSLSEQAIDQRRRHREPVDWSSLGHSERGQREERRPHAVERGWPASIGGRAWIGVEGSCGIAENQSRCWRRATAWADASGTGRPPTAPARWLRRKQNASSAATIIKRNGRLTLIIAAILAELQAKLADEDLEVKFQDIGPSGDAIVRGLITGRFLGQPINVTLNVYADGIELHKAGPTGGYFTEEFASTSKLSILNAGKGEYEALILDLLGID